MKKEKLNKEDAIDGCPVFEGFLQRSLPRGEDRERLREWMGKMLTDSEKASREMLVLSGDGAVGKTTMVSLMALLAGLERCVNIDPNQLFRPRYWHLLVDARLCCIDALELNKRGEMGLKRLILGERTWADVKGSDGFFFNPSAWVIATTNRPQEAVLSKGLQRRALWLEMVNPVFACQRRNIGNELVSEIDKIREWAVREG